MRLVVRERSIYLRIAALTILRFLRKRRQASSLTGVIREVMCTHLADNYRTGPSLLVCIVVS